jgi:hypothetical protein
MIKTLLGRSAESPEHLETFYLYVTAVCYAKMLKCTQNPSLSEPYLLCLQSLHTFPFLEKPSVVLGADGRNPDELFIKAIPIIAEALKVDIRNLEAVAKSEEPIEIYNKSTYMEFHHLLCKLRSFFRSLEQLQKLRMKAASSGNYNVEEILRALKKVWAIGHYLRTMVSGTAIEKHLKNIAHLLVVDTRKSWPDYAEDDNNNNNNNVVQFLKPNSMRKGQSLVPWQSYRDWLRLLVLYFNAAQVLVKFVATSNLPPPVSIFIKVFSPPLPDDRMASWKALLENERYFPSTLGETPDKDLVNFLNSHLNASRKKGVDIVAIIQSAQLLKQQHKSHLTGDVDKANTDIDLLAGQLMTCSLLGVPEDIKMIKEKIVTLKSLGFQNRLPQIQKILEMMAIFQKLVSRSTKDQNKSRRLSSL